MYNISDFATGVCFASAGAGFDNATSDVLVSINMHFPLHSLLPYYQVLHVKDILKVLYILQIRLYSIFFFVFFKGYYLPCLV
jgi:hypothetical protein